MTAPLTDEQLNRAIAVEIAKQNGWIFRDSGPLDDSPHWLVPLERKHHYENKYISNYTGDIAAAIDLPLETNDEKRRFAIELAKIVIPDINIGTAGIVYEAAFATARQRSEAWLTARRTNG